jgi:O-antigen/teichoic acid export membrane protein
MLKKLQLSNIRSFLFENKHSRQILFKNTFWLTVTEALDKSFSFVALILVARHFGPEIYGKFAFALSFLAVFIIIADFGFSTLTVREVAKNKSNSQQYIDNILFIKVFLSLITFILISICITFLNKDPESTGLV